MSRRRIEAAFWVSLARYHQALSEPGAVPARVQAGFIGELVSLARPGCGCRKPQVPAGTALAEAERLAADAAHKPAPDQVRERRDALEAATRPRRAMTRGTTR